MSRFILETYDISQQCILKVVYFSHGYSDRWMKNSKGQPTVPYAVLKDLVKKSLQNDGELKNEFFEDYQKKLVDALYKRLVDIGKVNGAKEYSRQRATDICANIRAIIVIECRKIGNPKVHCLNKNPQSPVAQYDEVSGIIKVDDIQWRLSGKDKDGPVFIGANEEGFFKKWWRHNKFLIWTSFVMLIIVPGIMIWGMLHIKKIAEQPPITPSPVQVLPVLNDSTLSSKEKYDSLILDSTSIKSNIFNSKQ